MPSIIRGSDGFDTAGGNAVRAWVNFNGTGPVAIRASYNVSSITDNGTGDYTVNFTNALVDANYSSVITSATIPAAPTGTLVCNTSDNTTARTSSALRMTTRYGNNDVLYDSPVVSVAIFR
jgi:hypothetical protein